MPSCFQGSPRHSLCYSHLRVSESSQELPQFISEILLGDQPIARNHNHTSRMELLVPWMGAEEKTILVDLERRFRTDLQRLSDLSHQTEGSHSLYYFYLRATESSQRLPRFFIWGDLDDQPITHFDSLTGKVEPLVSWMEGLEKESFLPPEWVFRSELEELPGLNRPTDGLVTWQVILGCEFREDGNKDGVFRYGYDGMDFISFEKETLTWVAAQPQAEKVKETWEEDPRWSQRNKVYLEETCIEWLKKYLSYRKKAPRKTEPPVGKVTRTVVDDSLEVLICQAFGFYPKEIQATWTRDGENWEQETFRRTVAPNSDGTYHYWLSIRIDPRERDRYRCHVEHDGLQEPLDMAPKEPKSNLGLIIGCVAAALVLVGLIAGILLLFLKRRHDYYKAVPKYFSPAAFLASDAESNSSDQEDI